MSNLLKTLVVLTLTLSNLWAYGRPEMQRFSLLHDRLTVERSLIRDAYSQFLNIDIQASSGIIDIIGDAKNGTKATTQTEKDLNMYQLLTKNVNTEKFIDANIIAGIPLPDVHYHQHHFLNSAFYQINLGFSLSINNQVLATNPVAQTYVRKETKMGLYSIYSHGSSTEQQIALYQMIRSDLSSELSYTALSADGKFFDFNSLTQEQKHIAVDWKWIKRDKNHRTELSVSELALLKQSDVKTKFGTGPLFHAAHFVTYDQNKYSLIPFAGFHYREHYRITNGLYLGVTYKGNDRLPVKATFKMDNQFMALMPTLDMKYFRFSYSFKNPYRNPQDDFWVAAMHQIDIGIPFP